MCVNCIPATDGYVRPMRAQRSGRYANDSEFGHSFSNRTTIVLQALDLMPDKKSSNVVFDGSAGGSHDLGSPILRRYSTLPRAPCWFARLVRLAQRAIGMAIRVGHQMATTSCWAMQAATIDPAGHPTVYPVSTSCMICTLLLYCQGRSLGATVWTSHSTIRLPANPSSED